MLNHYPDFAPAQKQLALLYAKDPNNDAKAYPLAVKALQAFPDDPEIARALGLIVFRQGDYSRAASLLTAERPSNEPGCGIDVLFGHGSISTQE